MSRFFSSMSISSPRHPMVGLGWGTTVIATARGARAYPRPVEEAWHGDRRERAPDADPQHRGPVRPVHGRVDRAHPGDWPQEARPDRVDAQAGPRAQPRFGEPRRARGAGGG